MTYFHLGVAVGLAVLELMLFSIQSNVFIAISRRKLVAK